MSVALFVRHGKASAFGANADYDQLSPLGVEQSEHLGEWIASEHVAIDAVFVGPRKRHAQTLDAVTRVVASRGGSLPAATLVEELDEHDGISLVFKMLPALAAQDAELRAVVEKTARGEPPSPADALSAFKRITRRWVRGEVAHDDVETWTAFRARVVRAMARIGSVGRGKTAIVFTSAGAVAAAVAHALDVRDEERVLDLSWAAHNASITELAFTGGKWGLRAFNATPHLREKRLVTSV